MKHQKASEASAWPAGIHISDHPVRRVHTRGRRRNTSLVYSSLPLGMRVAESSLEIQFLKVAQLDPGVSIIRAQPCWLRVVENGRIRRRAPDFAVMHRRQAELHELKQDQECWKPEVRSELLAVRDEVERHRRWLYSVSLESMLTAEPLRSNTDLLWRCLRPGDEIDDYLRLRTGEVLNNGSLTAAELIERTHRADIDACSSGSWNNLLALIAARIVDFDVDQHLTLDSVVWNGRSGPPRKRTLPFGTVDEAIVRPTKDRSPSSFCALQLRVASR